MTKKSHKVLLAILIAVFVIIETVCLLLFVDKCCTAVLYFDFGSKYDSKDDSLYASNIDGGLIEYSNKVQILWGVDEYDEVILCDSKEHIGNDEFFDGGYTILKGDITKYAWNDYKLYILLDGIFYEFDLNAYEPPALDENGDPRYQPKKYTKEEFENAFPGNRYDWDWYSGQ